MVAPSTDQPIPRPPPALSSCLAFVIWHTDRLDYLWVGDHPVLDPRRSVGRRSVRARIRAANRRCGHASRAPATSRVDDARHRRDRFHRCACGAGAARQRAQGCRSGRARLPIGGTVHSRPRCRRGTARDRVRCGHGATQRRDPTPSSERDRPHGNDHRPWIPRGEPHDRDSGEHPRDGERPRSNVGLRRRPPGELLFDRGASECRIPAHRRQSPHRAGREGVRGRTSTARPKPRPSCSATRITRRSASTSAPSAHPPSTGWE